MKGAFLVMFLIISVVTYSQFGYETIGNTIGVQNINNAVCGEVDSCFTLTANQNDQSGAVWDNKQINLSYNFDASFCLTLGSNDEWGADGFAFVMRGDNSSSLGTLGYGIGAVGISPSIAIEFDTWENIGFPTTDIAADHTALYFNGDFDTEIQGPTPLYPNSANAEDGGYHIARIVWNAQLQTLVMFFDGNLRINYTGDIVNTIFGGNPLITWGFTASTGGVSNLQQICFPKYSIDLENEKKICDTDSTTISFYDPNMTSYRWTFEDGTIIKDWNTLDFTAPFNLDDSIFYASQDGYYYLDLEINNQVIHDSVKLTVIQTPVKPFDKNYDLTCLEESNYILDALNPGIIYLWSTFQTGQQISISEPGIYNVTLVEPILFCTNQDTIEIVSFCQDTSICEGGVAEISFYHPDINNYKWYFEDGTILKNWNTIDFSTPFNLNDSNITVNEGGTYFLEVTFGNDSFLDSAVLTVINNPVMPFDKRYDLLCLSETNYSLNALNPGANYTWSTTETSQQIAISNAGVYSVTIVEPVLSCTTKDTIEIVNFCQDTLICEDGIAQFSFYHPAINNYKWYFEDGTVLVNWNVIPINLTDTIISVSKGGTYYLDVTLGPDSFTDSVELTVINKPIAPFDESLITLCLEEVDFTLDALNSGFTYLWSTLDTTQIISIDVAGTYSVEITEPILSCKNTDAITIISVCETIITFPNIFSPNNDGSNDIYELLLSNDFKWIGDFSFQVMNRWGEVVYEVSNQLVKWDGTQNGTELSEGTYFYSYTYKDVYTEEKHAGHGNIQLVK